MSLLKQKAKAKPTPTKKNSKPELEEETLAKNIADFLEAKKQVKTAEANISRAEQDIIAAAEQARLEHGTQTGQYESSYKVSASTGIVTVKFPNKYSKISSDNEDSLKELYGEADYEKYFEEKTECSMTEAAMKDDKFVEQMMGILGEEKFDRYFQVSTHITPTKTYHERRVTDQALAEKHQSAADAGLVSCTKPSLVAG